MIGVLKLLYLMLPVYAANMAPVLSRMIPRKYNLPLDFGLTYNNRSLLGSHKTMLGSLFGIGAAIAVVRLQYAYTPSAFDLVSYDHWLVFGSVLGVSTVLGDVIKSFFKRRIGKGPGEPWIPFDQVDYVIGALIGLRIFIKVSLIEMLMIIIMSGVGHIVINHLAYYTKIRKEKW